MMFNDWLNDVFRPKVQHVAAADIPGLADELVSQLIRNIDDQTAARYARDFLHCEAERRIKAWSRNAEGVIAKVHGRKQRKATRYSFTDVDPQTGDLVGRNHRSLWDISRDEFAAKMHDIDRQTMAMSDTQRIFHMVWDAWTSHPEAETARSAWTAEGKSTDEIDLDGAA